ncbi:hypothetical protein [Saccharibacillus qingshengii]|uniref:hypothetical protein n=1 Tax=Saccharibacillus qingshengii TaxID=1763540 RepID=UPI001556D2CF|nr:hypothetical protein [Saccharibacillus qingshengii]
MKNDNVGRWIEAEELKQFSKLKWNERIKWVREELNKLYVGHYSVKKVAANSRVISHSGLYNLEGSTSPLPRQSTMESLAAYYQVPETIFTATQPQRFFLGRRYEENDIRLAQYEVEIHYTLRSPIAKETPKERTFLLKTRHMDAEELLQRLEHEVDLTLKRLEKQSRLDKAYDTLRNVKEIE